jgi:hypothetical protein
LNDPKLPLQVWTYLTWYNFLLFSKKIFEEVFYVACPILVGLQI